MGKTVDEYDGGHNFDTKSQDSTKREYLRISAVLSIISHSKLSLKLEDPITPYEESLLNILTGITEGGKTVLDTHSINITPGKLVGGNFSFKCSNLMPLAYYLEPLVYLLPLSSEHTLVKLELPREGEGTEEFYKQFSTLEAFCSASTLILRTIGCEDASFRYKEPYEVIFECSPIRKIEPLDLSKEGKTKRIRGTVQVRALQPSLGKSAIIGAKKILSAVCDNVWIALASPPGKSEPSITISLIAEGTNCIHTADSTVYAKELESGETSHTTKYLANSSLSKILEIAGRKEAVLSKSDHGDASVPIHENSEYGDASIPIHEKCERIGTICAERLCTEISFGGYFDTTHQHIPLLFMCLSGDHRVSRLRISKLTRYTIVLLRQLKEFFRVSFKFEELEDGLIAKCVGINYNNLNMKTF